MNQQIECEWATGSVLAGQPNLANKWYENTAKSISIRLLFVPGGHDVDICVILHDLHYNNL